MIWANATLTDFSNNEYQTAYAALSPSRRAHVDRFGTEHRRRQSLAGEILAKRLLVDYTGIAPENIALHVDAAGKPFVEIDDLFLSIAHRGDIVVCAVDKTPIGIDVEDIKPIDLKLVKRVCTPQEAIFVFGHVPTDTDLTYTERVDILTRFYEIWTAKEAYVKMIGHTIAHFNELPVLSCNRQVFHLENHLVQVIQDTEYCNATDL